MSFETVLYEIADHVCTITINRPEKMNTWNATVAAELSEALHQANGDAEVRAVILTGAGRAVCAGADLESGADTFANRQSPETAEENVGVTYAWRRLQPRRVSFLPFGDDAGACCTPDRAAGGKEALQVKYGVRTR